MISDLNLASDPFRNLRPVRRAGLVLAILAVLLAALDAHTYWRHFTGEGQTRIQLQAIDRELSAERDSLAEQRRRLAFLEVSRLNRRARFVNEQIARRTFSWSALFDDLVSIQPLQLQLTSLDPNFGRESRSNRDLDLAPGEVLLKLEGRSRDTERLLSLIDSFFEHPSFRLPNLEREANNDGVLEFSLTVVYRPGVETEQAPDSDASEASDPATTAERDESLDEEDA